MNQALVDRLVKTVLYEGYNLYPYRPSVKNRCRWTFGGLYPRSYSEAMEGTDAWSMQVQCLVHGEEDSALEIQLRFLHLMERTIGVLCVPCDELHVGEDPAYQAVESFQLNGTHYQSWQEAVERDVTIGPLSLALLLGDAQVKSFSAPASHTLEPLRSSDGTVPAVIVRDQHSLEASVEISAERLEEASFRITVRVFNRGSLDSAGIRSRDEALMRALVATNAVLSIQNGTFLSLTDPPEDLRKATAACRNIGVWPVLVGTPGELDTMLASPIILGDYPQIAPESPGDLFDGTEIDEILTLRIMTLTEEEKAMAAATDDRTRRLLERTESLAREQLAGLHGAVRSFGPSARESVNGGWDPFADQRTITSICIDNVELRPGDRVRLRPGMGGDILDLALSGKIATIESIEQDYEDQFHVAVTLDDDPGQDLGRARQPGHRFFFKPEEVAPLDESGVGT